MARDCRSKQKSNGPATHRSQINAAYTTIEPMEKAPRNDKSTPETAGQERDETETKMKMANAKRAFRALSYAIRTNISDEEKQKRMKKFDTSAKELDDENFTKLQQFITAMDDVEKREGCFADLKERLAQQSRGISPNEVPRNGWEDQPTAEDNEIILLADEFHRQLAVTDVAKPTNEQPKDREGKAATKGKEYDSWETDEEACNCVPARSICWEETIQTWQDHIGICDKCQEWTLTRCPEHGQRATCGRIRTSVYCNARGTLLCNKESDSI